MGNTDGKESCGRCSVTTVLDAVEDGGDGHDPFDGGAIELEERELRIASWPALATGRVKQWLDGAAERAIYGG